jgi:hypothetical protein
MTSHCCEMMRRNVENTCAEHPNRHDCPDSLVEFWPGPRVYGLIIHDGGESVVRISYCPWCGAKLPEG